MAVRPPRDWHVQVVTAFGPATVSTHVSHAQGMKWLADNRYRVDRYGWPVFVGYRPPYDPDDLPIRVDRLRRLVGKGYQQARRD